MSRLDELPPDQRAALSLLLRQRKKYAEVATLLGVPEQAVHDRAHAALAVLAPRQARELSADRRREIGDYLLGQESVAERLSTRAYLNGAAPARAWARVIAAELAPLSSTPLPEIPAGPATEAPPGEGLRSRLASAPSDAGATPPTPTTSSSGLPSSRVGGALLLAAILVAVVVAVILLTSGGGSSSSHTSASTTGTTSAAATTATGPTVSQKIALRSPNPASRSVGAVEILTEGGKSAFYVAAEHLPPSHGFFYAIWLYNSPTSSLPLSKSPPVGANGRLAGGAPLPANAGSFREILLTRETSARPTRPGHVVLRGPFSLGG